jgi:CubicO group peptidase (beta-lactamase class C family)
MTRAVERLLALGRAGTHPASAIAGVRTATGTTVAAGGWAQLPSHGAPGQPMTTQMLLDLASVTKVAATTTLIMRLVADGQLTLQAPAHRFLPSFTGAGKDDITVEHLLTHTAGLPPWWPLYFEAQYCEAGDRDAALERAQSLPLSSGPGMAWCYSDLGLILAGAIVERVTALRLTDAFRQMVAEPLGLRARYGPVPAPAAAASADSDAYEFAMVATGRPYPVPFTTGQFSGWRNRPLRGEVNDGNAAHALGGVAGHAGLFATVGDLLSLGAAVRGGDFIPPPVLARFAAPTAIHPEQAVGFRRRRAPVGGTVRTLLYHSGFTGTYFAIGLEDELVVAGGAMRLYGTVGPIPADGPHPDASHLAAGTDIQSVLLDAATAAYGHASTYATPAEEL